MSKGVLQDTLVRVSDDSKALRSSLAELLGIQSQVALGAWKTHPSESWSTLVQKYVTVTSQLGRLNTDLDQVLAHHVLVPTESLPFVDRQVVPTPLPDLLATRCAFVAAPVIAPAVCTGHFHRGFWTAPRSNHRTPS